MARGSTVEQVKAQEDSVTMTMRDYRGHCIQRTVTFRKNQLAIHDKSKGQKIKSYLHLRESFPIHTENKRMESQFQYAQDYGRRIEIHGIQLIGLGEVKYSLDIS